MDPSAALEEWLSGWNTVLEHQASLQGWFSGGGFRPKVNVYSCEGNDVDVTPIPGEVIGVTRENIIVQFSKDDIAVFVTSFSELLGPHFTNNSTLECFHIEAA